MTKDPEREAERAMERADEANGEGREPSKGDGEDTVNDTEVRYGQDESPA